MIEGAVTTDGLPTIDLEIDGSLWSAVVDTGFNGDVELPTALRESVDARFAFRGRSFLAAGQSVEEDFYLVNFVFDGKTVTAEATFSESASILVGTQLLEDYRLEIDFPKKIVILQSVA